MYGASKQPGYSQLKTTVYRTGTLDVAAGAGAGMILFDGTPRFNIFDCYYSDEMMMYEAETFVNQKHCECLVNDGELQREKL